MPIVITFGLYLPKSEVISPFNSFISIELSSKNLVITIKRETHVDKLFYFMSFFGDLVTICAVAGTVSTVVTAVWGHYHVKAARAMGACAELPPSDDARKAARGMKGLILRRMHKLGFPAMWEIGQKRKGYTMLDTFDPDYERVLTDFVRMAHAVGCEVMLRARSEEDIENDPRGTDLYISKQREEWYA